MKMNYLLKSSNFEERKKTTRQKVAIIVFVLIIIMAVMLTGPAKKTLFFIAQPIWQVKNSIANSRLADYFKSKQTLINKNITLEQKIFLTGSLVALNSTLQNENDSLKDLLGRQDTKLKTVLAEVLVKPPQTPYDSLIVDIGSDQGIKVGDKVLANANVYIGEVSEVYPNSAKIILYSSPGEKRQVVLGESAISVEAIGVGGGNFNVFLPREVEVTVGDVIVIPSITANVFGIVEKVDFKDKDSFQTILFKSPINISELGLVEIVL